MADEHPRSRRAFTLDSLLAIFAAAVIAASGCGGGIDLGPTAPSGDREGVVSNNHGHRAIVTAAQLASNNTVVVDMRFRATHNHELALSALELAAIAENGQVVKTSSSTDGHNHIVTFN